MLLIYDSVKIHNYLASPASPYYVINHLGPSISDVMLFWGILYPPPPPPVMRFYAPFTIVGHAYPNPPCPLRHDVILWTAPLLPWDLRDHPYLVQEPNPEFLQKTTLPYTVSPLNFLDLFSS